MAVGSASGIAAGRAVVAVAPTIKKSPHPLNAAFERTWHNPLGFFGLLILGVLVLAAKDRRLVAVELELAEAADLELLAERFDLGAHGALSAAPLFRDIGQLGGIDDS